MRDTCIYFSLDTGWLSSGENVSGTRSLSPSLRQTPEHDQRPVRRPSTDQPTGQEGRGAHAESGLCGKSL